MTVRPVQAVFHPSDFSDASEVAFAHALKLALVARASLTMMHVYADAGAGSADFPGVRRTLERWGLLPAGSAREAVGRLGLEIYRVRAMHADPVRSVLDFLESHPTDLIVLSTGRREGRAQWLRRSVSEPIARESGAMTLFVPEGVEGFVSWQDGSLSLGNVLIPVASQPRPQPSVDAVVRAGHALGLARLNVTLLHVGGPDGVPPVRTEARPGWTWRTVTPEGDVVETIGAVAAEVGADLIVMTTEGHHGFLDALRGSTSERVLRAARCPLLAIPARAAPA
jgi:nucleotide-binding universal stress UspA family protein